VLNVGEESFRYDANTESHPHIRCTQCGRVDDVFDVDDSGLMKAVEEKTAYRMTGRQIYFYGICPRCQKKMHTVH
jgi:Fur family peroxide stress response transcriptional regulator